MSEENKVKLGNEELDEVTGGADPQDPSLGIRVKEAGIPRGGKVAVRVKTSEEEDGANGELAGIPRGGRVV